MDYFFSQIIRSVGVFFRTVRAFFSRKLMGFTSMLRRMTNFSRHATKVASSSLQGVMTAAQKPSDPSDYIETDGYYISKALIIRALLGLVAFGLIVWFLVWPFILSRFLTARFYQEDSRVSDWTGRVIVYSDQKKTVPLYSGRLEKGALQGEGRLYDADGVLVYEGQMADGERSGNGKAYVNGILSYEGQFSAGRYNGYGKSWDEDKLVYEGQFADGLFEGSGKLYRDGVLAYDGGFHAGTESGTGVAYDDEGNISYQGQFSGGKREGDGTAYDGNGRKVYAGSFAQDEYNGDGVLFFSDDSQLEGKFQNGEPGGVVRWEKNGRLYYEGEWSEGAPSGLGTLYSRAGKRLYEGPFLNGTIDGRALMDWSVEDLRTALAEGAVTNENEETGFRIIAEELGLTALCTFRTESADPAIYQIYLSAPGKDGWVDLLPGAEQTNGVPWPEGAAPEKFFVRFDGQRGVSLGPDTYAAESVSGQDVSVSALYEDRKRERVALLTWFRGNVTGPAQPAGAGSGESDGSGEDPLLDGICRMLSSGGTAADAGVPTEGLDAGYALRYAKDAGEAAALTNAMLDHWEAKQRLAALEEISGRCGALLAEAQTAAAEGLGQGEAAQSLAQKQLELETQAESCKTAMQRAELQANALGTAGLDGYAPESLLLFFDPSQLSAEALSPIAAAYAGSAGDGADPAAVSGDVRVALLDLTDAYGAVLPAQTRYRTALKADSDARDGFSMGVVTREAQYAAADELAASRADLCGAVAEFSRRANRLNLLTGGWVSRAYNWSRGFF